MIVMISIIIVCLGLLFFLYKKINGNKKEVKKEGDKPKTEENISNLNTNKIQVTIFRPISKDLFAQVGQPIIAEEKPDNNNNLMVINEKARFKEDFNFSIDRVYENLEFSLNLKGKSKKEREERLNAEIKTVEALIKEIKADVKKNETYNLRDEELRLRQLKVFRDSLKKETRGNYMRLGVGGIRMYELVSVDGVLYPNFFGGNIFRVYPDLLAKKKIFNQENTIFRNETAALFKNALNWTTVIALVIGLIMMAGGGLMLYKGYSKNTEVTMIANKGALTCTNTLASIQSSYGLVIEDYIRQQNKIKSENVIKDKDTNNNNVGVKEILIDPTKISK